VRTGLTTQEELTARDVYLALGALSSFLYASGDVVASMLYPDYHDYASQMVSELMARGAPTRTLMVSLFVPYNVLVFVFAAGVWASGMRRTVRLTAAALVGYGAISTAGLLVAPMDLRADGLTGGTVFHIWATVLQGVFILLVLVFGAFIHGLRFRWYSFATLAVCVGLGAWAGVQARQGSMWIGVTERISVYAWMLWVSVLAVSLIRSTGTSNGTSSPRLASTVNFRD
jgi:hypothetical protein